MRLSEEQSLLVEENLGLIGQVLKDCVQAPQCAVLSMEDLEQIGRVGLCKAACAYKPRNARFSTYAYIVIRNEIYKALSKDWCHSKHEEYLTEDAGASGTAEQDNIVELLSVLEAEKTHMPKSAAKGVDALIMLAEGYSCKEIAAVYGCPTNLVTAWMSNARRHLKQSRALGAYVRSGI